MHTPSPPSVWIILIPVLLMGVLSLLIPFLTWKRQPPPDDDAWRGIFYWNPKDPALFVPKRFGIGYTLNFGNPWSWVVLAAIFIIAMLPLVFVGMNVFQSPAPR
jgi:Family of unknown function (DUF5808)